MGIKDWFSLDEERTHAQADWFRRAGLWLHAVVMGGFASLAGAILLIAIDIAVGPSFIEGSLPGVQNNGGFFKYLPWAISGGLTILQMVMFRKIDSVQDLLGLLKGREGGVIIFGLVLMAVDTASDWGSILSYYYGYDDAKDLVPSKWELWPILWTSIGTALCASGEWLALSLLRRTQPDRS